MQLLCKKYELLKVETFYVIRTKVEQRESLRTIVNIGEGNSIEIKEGNRLSKEKREGLIIQHLILGIIKV